MYEKTQVQGTSFHIYPRMVGNGGFSDIPSDPVRLDGLWAYDKRVYQEIPNDVGGKHPVGFNGFFKLVVKGNELEVSYITGKCKSGDCTLGYDANEGDIVASETITVDASSGEVSQTKKHTSVLTVPNQGRLRGSASEAMIANMTSLDSQCHTYCGGMYALTNTSMD